MKIFNWTSYSIFFSASNTQSFLKSCYLQKQIENAERKAYENCYPYIYYLEHGKVYFEQAKSSPLIIQPILLFYGLIHLLKACILTIDPNYPETTSVLAHGVSARKRKKQQYQFFQDEVKIQKSGLFPFIAEQLFHMKQLEGEKVSMSCLLKQIPELSHLFSLLERKHTFMLIKNKEKQFLIPKNILDIFHMTENRFIDFFQDKSNRNFSFEQSNESTLIFRKGSNLDTQLLPLKYNLMEKSYALPLTKDKLLQFHEILVHYLLLYNLSMIARYETEWWSELVKTMPNKDFPFIEAFLHMTMEKSPFLVYEYLMGKI